MKWRRCICIKSSSKILFTVVGICIVVIGCNKPVSVFQYLENTTPAMEFWQSELMKYVEGNLYSSPFIGATKSELMILSYEPENRLHYLIDQNSTGVQSNCIISSFTYFGFSDRYINSLWLNSRTLKTINASIDGKEKSESVAIVEFGENGLVEKIKHMLEIDSNNNYYEDDYDYNISTKTVVNNSYYNGNHVFTETNTWNDLGFLVISSIDVSDYASSEDSPFDYLHNIKKKTYVYQYDKFGNILNEKWIIDNILEKERIYTYEYKYNTLISTRQDTTKKQEILILKYIDGRLTSKKTNLGETFYYYDSSNNIREEKGPNYRMEYEYDDQSRLVKKSSDYQVTTIEYFGDRIITTLYRNGESNTIKIEYTNSELGLVCEYGKENNEDNQLIIDYKIVVKDSNL